MKSMIEKMLKMQRALDDAIYKEHQVEFDKEKCKLAMMDEGVRPADFGRPYTSRS